MDTPQFHQTTLANGLQTWSRHAAPASWCCFPHTAGLDPEAYRMAVAVHEAGHLVLDLRVGIHVNSVEITPEDINNGCGAQRVVHGVTEIGIVAVRRSQYVTMLAAGEQADLRWLREQGLWTPDRAWAAEMAALDDREKAIPVVKDLVPTDHRLEAIATYWGFSDAAAAELDGCWQQVIAVATSLDSAGRLSGDEAAAIAGLANPPEPPTE
ncbi:hypothetical protein ACF07Y_39230 [Streptomyces sp. NPDC016566]|uniref:hypothetical protein n=1 Tax=Streptomyces sp. NPDC016566 TaxID=3364967 RepID=UPI0036F9DEC6